MTNENKLYNFQVNLKGMIELLSEHIYSTPNVFVRELLQNGIDAITARRGIVDNYDGEINIRVSENPINLIFEDNGIGLTEDEVHRFLSVIGQSSKRGDASEKDFIGRFGIGLLSCFVVSNEIIVETCSLIKGKGVRWTGKADGTYILEEIAESMQPGTRVILYPKDEWKPLFTKDELQKNVMYFGSALPVKINIISSGGTETLNKEIPIWLNPSSTKAELLEYGRETFNINFLDAFRLKSEVGTITGVGYIIPHKVQFTGTKYHKVYLKKMFICEEAGSLLPEWASFVKCIINSNTLKPTASRESLMENKELKAAQKELNNNFKEYLRLLTITDLKTLNEIIKTHHLYIKALAAEDTELLKMFIDYIPFETNKGVLSFESIKTYNPQIYYTSNIDDYRQIRRIAGSQGKTVINAGYSFETDLIRKIKIVYPDIYLEKITPQQVLENFGKQVDDEDIYQSFLERADKLLKKYYCKSEIKHFEPADTPVIYVANDEALNNKTINNLKEAANPFAATLKGFTKGDAMPSLCFNKDNVIIDDIITLEDETLFEAVINILYIQALMLGNYPLNKKEMNVFNDSIYKFLVMGMNNLSGKLIL